MVFEEKVNATRGPVLTSEWEAVTVGFEPRQAVRINVNAINSRYCASRYAYSGPTGIVSADYCVVETIRCEWGFVKFARKNR
jgi:hypothetical protein